MALLLGGEPLVGELDIVVLFQQCVSLFRNTNTILLLIIIIT